MLYQKDTLNNFYHYRIIFIFIALCLERLKAIDHSDWKTIQNYRFSLLCLFIAIIIITVTPLQLASGQLCISNDPDDIDGDGISNKWEVEGIDINGDNKIDLNLGSSWSQSSSQRFIFGGRLYEVS